MNEGWQQRAVAVLVVLFVVFFVVGIFAELVRWLIINERLDLILLLIFGLPLAAVCIQFIAVGE